MCGRFNITPENSYLLSALLEELRGSYPEREFVPGEICPSCYAPLIFGKNGLEFHDLTKWGLRLARNKLLINVRAESAETRPAFSKYFETNRCLIPCTGFYEWSPQKKKFLFKFKDDETLFLAGFHNGENNGRNFVVLTTEANESMRGVHHRMPVVVPEKYRDEWLFDINFASRYMLSVQPELTKREAI